MITRAYPRSSSELEWFKSSYSDNDGPSCVEVAADPGTVRIRDSKNKQGPSLRVTPNQWSTFLVYAAKAPLA